MNIQDHNRIALAVATYLQVEADYAASTDLGRVIIKDATRGVWQFAVDGPLWVGDLFDDVGNFIEARSLGLPTYVTDPEIIGKAIIDVLSRGSA